MVLKLDSPASIVVGGIAMIGEPFGAAGVEISRNQAVGPEQDLLYELDRQAGLMAAANSARKNLKNCLDKYY